ncbi:alpha/beta hydrolase [Qipengyuania sp. MTN3-11]|uniref:alpha/beta hydrolase n=1 Tax=Qipengyuania sp. MTN3-11 TaxID=3056557 RepID=UPI0036F1B723
MTRRRPGKLGWTVIAIAFLALIGFALWRWAVAAGSSGTLDWIDARFARDRAAELVATSGDEPASELWVPEGEPPPGGFPLIVFSHGGGWHSGSPSDYRFVARTFADKGYAAALIGYRLVPEGRYPAMLEDSAAALRWVRDAAERENVDADSMILVGHSAGAYNVLMLGLEPRWLEAAGVPPDTIAGVVSMAGPADFFPFDKESSINAFGHVADGRITQPIRFARADAPPLLLQHGTADTVVRPYNSRNLAQAMQAAGGEAELVEYDGMSHAGLVMGLSRPFAQGGRVLDPILAFAREALSERTASANNSSVPVQRESR